MWKSLKVQNALGYVFLILLFLGLSWGITCLFVYWISVLWTNTIFAFDWSWEFATGIWLALILLDCFIDMRVNINDR